MKITKFTGLVLAGLSLCLTAQAQDEAPSNFISAAYYYCSQAKEEAADAEMMNKARPIYDAAVADGTINSWGWLAHRSGGKWRRLLYFSNTGIEAAMAAADKLYPAVTEAMGEDSVFWDACPSHEDYIWQSDNTGGSGTERGAYGLTVYFHCDSSREERADEIVKETLGPIMDNLVKNGNLTTWGWIGHYIGGKYRRALTMTGTSHLGNLKARDYSVDIFYAEGSKAGAEFNAICSDHSDYLWDIQHEKP
jgi:hypothetical protein